MAFQDYQSIKNLGELNNELDFNSWYRKQQAAADMAKQAKIASSRGELTIPAITRIGTALLTGNPLALIAPGEAIAQQGNKQSNTQTYMPSPIDASQSGTKYGIGSVGIPEYKRLNMAKAMDVEPFAEYNPENTNNYMDYSRYLGGVV